MRLVPDARDTGPDCVCSSVAADLHSALVPAMSAAAVNPPHIAKQLSLGIQAPRLSVAAVSVLLLQDDMRAKLGQLESRLRVYRLDEVFQRNAAGECWLILDGAPRLARHRSQLLDG